MYEKFDYPYININTSNNQYIPHYYPGFHRPEPSFPPVDATMFIQSAQRMNVLLTDVTTVLNKITSSHSFAINLMNAAQQSDMDKVKQMIKSTGIKHIPIIQYTPSSLSLDFYAANKQTQCCQLSINLRWSK